MPTIVPVLLSGGSGTRLWPLSRKSYPKQFAPLTGDMTLFQAAAGRVAGPGFASPVIVTNADFRFIVAEQLQAVGIDPGAVLIEPEGRNTAPAILAAALHVAATTPDALMLVCPSDHVVPDAAAFRAAVEAGRGAAEAGDLVTFGITPTRPETGYGWLELSATPDGLAPVPLARFVEKPDLATAQRMFDAGSYLWNAGIFLFSVRTILAAFAAHVPDMLDPVRRALDEARPDLGFLRIAPDPWGQAEAISIDCAVMERAANRAVVPFAGGWSDLGDWQAVWREAGPDAQGNVLSGPATAIRCEGSLLRSEAPGLELVGLGLRDIIAVALPDAVLVAHRDCAQEVKEAVAAMKARGADQAESFPLDHRPWGWFETLVLGDRFRVKRILVKPGGVLSLQSHHHRSEHWIVVAGTAKVTVDGEARLVTENQSVYVPLGSVHRMENPGKVPMVLIEVQTGAYLGEDDILRYEDAYARG
ncbi:mannose-1-phosphate guanylyltransferase/mannose-1-phosphate guanylyltransferase/mannose-6-phosphate isomerase [Cereibacter ovatus]|uniref:mannose-1-phosphate guanylyltransferase n=1 Tax=Cereibacter ovatus TaxID=439529 RepID=A0A285D4N8_9RHOB|nr:mannose-1-phosphate guanylyltransferase/mannose-6-phosphate isomerase [Cereibacter ovatus]SNX74286.1 mannose-1-phosphate guanylyltransferase/mannose-1-phosphate guanylyltransferase/mannose-6-phosphate isomerase [Cereibacter ovatus]